MSDDDVSGLLLLKFSTFYNLAKVSSSADRVVRSLSDYFSSNDTEYYCHFVLKYRLILRYRCITRYSAVFGGHLGRVDLTTMRKG